MILMYIRSMNHGGMGVTLAHELSHSLDYNNLKYDEQGIYHDWLDVESDQEIRERAYCFIYQYKEFIVDDINVSLFIVVIFIVITFRIGLSTNDLILTR